MKEKILKAVSKISLSKFFKKNFPRVMAVILSILTLFSSFPAFALTEGNSYSFEKTYLNAYYETGKWQTANGETHDNWGQVSLYNLISTGEPIYCLQIYNAVDGSATTANSINRIIAVFICSFTLKIGVFSFLT